MTTTKRFRFPRGIRQVNIPFMLSDYSPWQKQVGEEMMRVQRQMGTSKRAHWGYSIENGDAQIYVYKRI